MKTLRSKGFQTGSFVGEKNQMRMCGHVVKGEAFKFLTAKQVNAILEVIWNDTECHQRERNHCAVFCGFYLGLRVGEAAILEPRHLQHIGQEVIMIPTLKQKKKRKTDAPPEIMIRDIEPEVIKYLQWYLGRHGEQHWMFPNAYHPKKHMSEWSLNQMFATYAAAAGLPPEYSWHALRHGRGMTVWNATKDLKAVQALLRHKTVAMAERYSHMDPEKKAERLSSLSSRFISPEMAAN
jgi:integrase